MRIVEIRTLRKLSSEGDCYIFSDDFNFLEPFPILYMVISYIYYEEAILHWLNFCTQAFEL